MGELLDKMSIGTRSMAEKARLEKEIQNMENDKYQLALIAGNKVYKYFMNNSEGDIPRSEIESICNEITERNNRIVMLKGKLNELAAEVEYLMNANLNPYSQPAPYQNVPNQYMQQGANPYAPPVQNQYAQQSMPNQYATSQSAPNPYQPPVQNGYNVQQATSQAQNPVQQYPGMCSCGFVNSPTSKFCAKCGTKLEK
ncbi:MAG: hypothetical protein E7391_06595 [Ruminococcaceae bacterium]|nr:hypothetical protein [Oscillospiraceae bacterium]